MGAKCFAEFFQASLESHSVALEARRGYFSEIIDLYSGRVWWSEHIVSETFHAQLDTPSGFIKGDYFLNNTDACIAHAKSERMGLSSRLITLNGARYINIGISEEPAQNQQSNLVMSLEKDLRDSLRQLNAHVFGLRANMSVLFSKGSFINKLDTHIGTFIQIKGNLGATLASLGSVYYQLYKNHCYRFHGELISINWQEFDQPCCALGPVH